MFINYLETDLLILLMDIDSLRNRIVNKIKTGYIVKVLNLLTICIYKKIK